MIKVAALTQGVNVPSTRFRFLQYMPYLVEADMEVFHLPALYSAYPPAEFVNRVLWMPKTIGDAFSRVRSANNSDLCFLQRELISTIRTAETFLRKPFIFDVDDAIYLNQKWSSLDKLAKHARLIICGNRTLAEHYAHYGEVVVLPTAVDTARYAPIQIMPNRPLVIGWSGSSSGFAYLKMIEPAIKKILEMHPQAIFTVMAEARPSLPTLPSNRFNFIPWSVESEISVLHSFAIGLMPLIDDAWSRGKCSFKMITYMSCGVPVVASPVGMNSDILNLSNLGFAAHGVDDWVQSIDTLLRDPNLRYTLGMAGRKVAEKYFASNVIGPRLAAILKESLY